MTCTACSGQWEEDNILWLEDVGVRAYGQFCYDDEDLYIHLRAKEKDIRAINPGTSDT